MRTRVRYRTAYLVLFSLLAFLLFLPVPSAGAIDRVAVISGSPTISYPAENEVVPHRDLTIRWSPVPGAATYTFILTNQTTGAQIDYAITTETSRTISASSLNAGHHYRIFASANDSNGSGWGTLRNFQVRTDSPEPMPGPGITPPVVRFPVANSTVALQDLLIRWGAVSGAASYTVILHDITSGTDVEFAPLIEATSWTVNASSLTAGHNYRLFVSANEPSGSGQGNFVYFQVDITSGGNGNGGGSSNGGSSGRGSGGGTNPPPGDDHSDVRVGATPIELDRPVAGRFELDEDQDVFRFQPPETSTYVFTSSGSTDTYAELHDHMAIRMTSDDDSNGGGQFRIEQRLLRGQTYYLVVVPFSGRGGGSYTVTVQQKGGGTTPPPLSTEDDYGNNFSTATLYPLGSLIFGQIEYAGDNDYFRFQAPVSGTYAIRSMGSSDMYGYLYSNSQNELSSDDDTGGNGQFLISANLTAGQTYYIRVRAYDSGSIINYGLEVSGPGPSSSQHSVSISASGLPAHEVLLPPGDSRYYAYSVTGDSEIERLFLQYRRNGEYVGERPLPQSGQLDFVRTGYMSQPGDYTLHLMAKAQGESQPRQIWLGRVRVTEPIPVGNANALANWMRYWNQEHLTIEVIHGEHFDFDDVTESRRMNLPEWKPTFKEVAATWNQTMGWMISANDVESLWPDVRLSYVNGQLQFKNHMNGDLPSIEASYYPWRELACATSGACQGTMISLASLIERFNLQDYVVMANNWNGARLQFWPVYPTLLIHGINSNGEGTWNNFIQARETIDLMTVRFTYASGGTNPTIKNHLRDLSGLAQGALQARDILNWMLARTGSPKVNIVAHSKGGVVARMLVANHGSEISSNIGRIITLDSPHQVYAGIPGGQISERSDVATLRAAEWPATASTTVLELAVSASVKSGCVAWATQTPGHFVVYVDQITYRDCLYGNSQLPIAHNYVGNTIAWVLYQADWWPPDSEWGSLQFNGGNNCSRKRLVSGADHAGIHDRPVVALIVSDLVSYDQACPPLPNLNYKTRYVLHATVSNGSLTIGEYEVPKAHLLFGHPSAPDWDPRDDSSGSR